MSLKPLPKAILVGAVIAVAGYGASLINLDKFVKKEPIIDAPTTVDVVQQPTSQSVSPVHVPSTAPAIMAPAPQEQKPVEAPTPISSPPAMNKALESLINSGTK